MVGICVLMVGCCKFIALDLLGVCTYFWQVACALVVCLLGLVWVCCFCVLVIALFVGLGYGCLWLYELVLFVSCLWCVVLSVCYFGLPLVCFVLLWVGFGFCCLIVLLLVMLLCGGTDVCCLFIVVVGLAVGCYFCFGWFDW